MGLEIEYLEGQTPLDEEEIEGLKIKSISTRRELDEFEQLNIEKAIQWTMGKPFSADQVFSEAFVKEVHYRMFKDVWTWAGQFRKTNKNMGVEWPQVGLSLKQHCDDCKFWVAHQTYSEEEIAIRFKHQIVSIHCFSNGNGRHSRLMADIIINALFKKPVFSWGRLANENEIRSDYLNVIRIADKGSITPLIGFAQS
jgi:Fic-DOC domain mobile mystery protein B